MSRFSNQVSGSTIVDFFVDLGLDVLGSYPIGSEWTLRVYVGGGVEGFGVFYGGMEGVKILESGSIGVLRVVNRSDSMVFMIPGVIVSGVSQDRIIRRPVIIPPTPEEPYEIPSYCVEAGRGLVSSVFRGILVAPLDFRISALSHFVTQDIIWRRIDRGYEELVERTDIPREITSEPLKTRPLRALMTLSLVSKDRSIRDQLSRISTTYRSIESIARQSRELGREVERMRREKPRVEEIRTLDMWIGSIIRLCEWGLERDMSHRGARRSYLADLYGLLHRGRRPKHSELDDLERIKLDTILRRTISIISKHTGLDKGEVSRHLEEYGLHRVLAEKTADIDVYGMTREIMELMKKHEVREGYEKIRGRMDRIHGELDEIARSINRYLRRIEDLYHRAKELMRRLRDETLWGLRESICTPESFGIEYREDIIGYSLLRDGKIVCTEIMPANIPKKLWTGIFQSIILYIMYHRDGERIDKGHKTTTEKLLDKYILTISETTEKIQAKVTENGKTIYCFEAYY